MPSPNVRWKSEPDDHQYHAAFDYLSLHYDQMRADHFVVRLRKGELTHRKAKDLIRASGLVPWPADNPYVARHLEKWQTPKGAVGPALVVRDRPIIIADGWHRICAAYWVDENTLVACKIA